MLDNQLGKETKARYYSPMKYSVPQPVTETLDTLAKADFEAYIVGGCVRDILLARTPKDWDITTSAKPDEILALFEGSFYENEFGTVGVKVPRFLPTTPSEKEHDVIEVTTYRTESAYSDNRRPDAVAFVSTIEEDLARRDFTMNAIAAKPTSHESRVTSHEENTPEVDLELIDPFDGQRDIAAKVIRAVGDADVRFGEDALRMMRAIRLFSELSENTRHETRDTRTPIGKSKKRRLKRYGSMRRTSRMCRGSASGTSSRASSAPVTRRTASTSSRRPDSSR